MVYFLSLRRRTLLGLAKCGNSPQLLRRERLFAERAVVVPAEPRLDALGVKVVAPVTGQWCDSVLVSELLKADRALIVVVELVNDEKF